MLTMGKPIQPKSARPMGILGEMFAEKICGNYEQLRGRIDPVEILHFLSAPPELYLAETEVTALVNQEDKAEPLKLELSLVNNVLNRILMSAHMTFTYQDRIFVENILKKLGVTDVREFIRQVRMVKEETAAVRELLSVYESGQDAIRLIQEYRRDQAAAQKTFAAAKTAGQEETEAADRLALMVLKRLQAAAIYREVERFAAFQIDNRKTIERREMTFGAQHIAASFLTLNDYRQRILSQDQNMIYDLPDQYEAWEISFAKETYGQTVNRFLQAALLQAVRQIFHIRYEDFTRHTGWRHEFMDALHVSVRNTFQRMISNPEGMLFAIRDRETYHRTARQFEKQEIMALKNLFALSGEMTVSEPHTMEIVQAAQDRTAYFETRGEDTYLSTVRQEKEQRKEHSPQEAEKLRVERENEIREWLASIDRQNRERVERLSEYTSRIEKQGERRQFFEKMTTDAHRTRTGPEEEGLTYREQETAHTEKTERETEKLREILGGETVRIFETIRSYQENPGQYPNVTTSKERAVDLFLRDIAAAGKVQEAHFVTEPEEIVYDRIRHADSAQTAHPFQGTVVGGTASGRRGHPAGQLFGEREPAVELFHRQSEQTLSEERMRELMQTLTKDRQVQNAAVRETVNVEERVTGIVRSKVNEMKRKQDEEIARMISQNVKRQLDTLSEKVYGKLERRMDAERRRRGL